MTAKEKSDRDHTVFVRDATGLVRNVGFFNAVSLNLSDLAVAGTFALLGYTLVVLPTVSGVNFLIANIIAFALAIPQIVVYSIMLNKFPRTGGDYIWVSRNIGGFWGNAAIWVGPGLNGLPFIALILLSTVFALGSVGLFFQPTSSTYLALALPGNLGGNPSMQFAIAIGIFALLILLNIVRPRWGFRSLSVFAIYGIITTLIAILVLFIGGHQGVVGYMNSLGNANLTYSAIASSYTGSSFNLSNTLFLIPYFAIFAYPFMNGTPVAGSELKGKNTLKWSIPVALIIVFVMDSLGFGSMYYAGGLPFINSALSNPTLVYNYAFNFYTLSMGVSNNFFLQILIGSSWVIWNIALVGLIIIMFSRYIFAQAFDRFVPSSFAYVSPKFGSPIVAHLVDFAIVGSMVGVAAFLYGSFQSLYATVIGSMFYYLAVGLSVGIYAIRREAGRLKATLLICGSLMVVVYLYVIYTFFAYPAIWASSVVVNGIPGYVFSYLFVVACFVLAVIVYFVSRSFHLRKGIDIAMAYKEIPPE